MPSRDFDTTMSSARDYNPSGSRTASASSSPNLSMPNIPTVLSRSNSSTSLRDVTTIDDDELEASIIQDEEEEMSKQPPKKRRRISETPDSDIAEETLFEHELPPSPNAQSINRKDVSPDLIVLPSQKKSAPPIRQETVNTMSASWSHILDKASTKSSCHEEAAESSHADFLQRFRNSTQPTKPIQLDEGADGEEVVDQDEDVHTLPKDNDLLNTELSKSPPFPLQSTPAQGLPNPPSSSPPQPTLSQGLPKPPPLRPTQLSLQVQPVASSCQPKSKTSSNPPRSETNSSACPSDNDTPEIEAATDTFVPPHDTIRVDLVSLKQAYDARAAALRSLKNKAAPAIPLVRDSELEHAAGLEAAEANAQAALSRTVQQPDFEKMSICGQFNLGFIIARRTIERGAEIEDDLFIIGQCSFLSPLAQLADSPVKTNMPVTKNTTSKLCKPIRSSSIKPN